MIRRPATMVAVALIQAVLTASAVAAAPGSAVPRVAPEEFAILPWGWTPADPEVLTAIHECGFNLAGFVHADGLDAVAAAGLKCLVSDSTTHVGDDIADMDEAEMARRVEAIVGRAGKHPATYGFYLRDEPSAKMYPALARWREAITKAAPDLRSYINLFPNYASAGQMGVATYDEYVESFVSTVHPPFVSYDHYALMANGSMRKGYFPNLETVRRVALKHGLPFWNIVLSNAHFQYAEPSDATFRLQAYTTMAYGARGISYFTYFTPATGNYRLAPIDQFGHKTPTWDMQRSINLQIHRLAPTLVKLESVHVFHHPNVPPGCAALDTSYHVAQLSGGDFMVGEFKNEEGRPAVMVVNKSLTESSAFAIRFKEPGTITQTNAYTGGTHPWAGENIWLAPGQGMLLSVDK